MSDGLRTEARAELLTIRLEDIFGEADERIPGKNGIELLRWYPTPFSHLPSKTSIELILDQPHWILLCRDLETRQILWSRAQPWSDMT